MKHKLAEANQEHNKPVFRQTGDVTMEILELMQTFAAMTGIVLILLGSDWLKGYLLKSVR